MKSCNIFRNKVTGKIESVKAPNGKESILYKDLVNLLPDQIELDEYTRQALTEGLIKDNSKEEVALAIWSKVYTPSFKEWFGDSKVVDKNSEPLLVFHGTSNPSSFDIKEFRDSDEQGFSPGVYFHTNQNYIKELRYNYFGKDVEKDNRMYPVFLSLKNPKYMDGIHTGVAKWEFEKNNIDGIIGKDQGQEFIVPDGKTYVARNAEQIKSVYNDGGFKLKNRNMYHNMSDTLIEDISPNLKNTLYTFLNSIGADIKLVDVVIDKNGNPTNYYGKADIVNGIIEVLKGNKGINSLPEEASHIITALLGKNHPLMIQMMRKITEYDVYTKVKNEYADVYDNEEDFRFEAVGKLIARHIINQDKGLSQNQSTETKGWWDRVITILKRLIFPKNTESISKAMNEFELVADAIITNDNNKILNKAKLKSKLEKTKSDTSLQPKEFYNANSPGQGEIRKKFLDTHARLKGIIKVGDKELYELQDKVLGKRVSNLQDKLFAKNRTKAEVERINNLPTSINAASAGTVMHDYNDDIANYIIGQVDNLNVGDPKNVQNTMPATPSILPPVFQQEVQNSIISLIKGISELQNSIDPNGKADIYTENFVVDDNKDVGGSMDITVVYSDGSVSIYDYKFIQFPKQRNALGLSYTPSDTHISPIKEKSYSLQLSEYKRILKEVYGITKIRSVRILPFSVTYQIDETTKLPTGKISSLEGFKNSKDYLMPLPVANELTLDPEVNKLLSELFTQQTKLTNSLSSSVSDPDKYQRITSELSSLSKSIKYIQVLNDFGPLFDSINTSLDNMGAVAKDIDINNISELNRMKADIELFNTLYTSIVSHTNNPKLNQYLKDISLRLTVADAVITQKITDLILELDSKMGTMQKEIEGMKAHFSYLSQIDHPVFEQANSLLKTVNGNVNRASLELNKKLESKTNDLQSWAKTKGLTLWDAFSKIISDKGTLINESSADFYKAKAKAMDEGDYKWMQEHYKVKSGAKEEYTKNYNEYLKFLETIYKKGTAGYDRLLERWISNNDLSISAGAWTNTFTLWRYAELKNPEKYYSSEYKELLKPENKALKDYYDFYIQTNKELNMLTGEKIDNNFIANVKKEWTEEIARTGSILDGSKKAKDDFKKSFETQQHDELLSSSGEVDIPLMHYGSIITKQDGKWVKDGDNKSIDLSRSLQLFAHAVYKKHELSKIRGIIDALQIFIENEQVILTDGVGHAKVDKFTNEIAIGKSNKNAELFRQHMKALVYGERLQNKDTVFMENYSSNKTVTNVMTMFSVNTLALSYVSAFGNVGSGTANAFIKGVGGRYYNNNQLRSAINLRITKGDGNKFKIMAEHFKIENENWNTKLADNLSATKLTKNATVSKAFTLWQAGDDFVSNIVLVAMSKNYGIDSDGNVTRLALLPKDSKSIYEMFTIKGKDGKSNLTNTQFDDFRRMVSYISRQIKGSNTTEELSRAQMTVWGKTYMFFKNWLPPMASERFGSLKYTADLKEFEYGRFRSVFKAATKGYFLKKLPMLLLNLRNVSKLNETTFKDDFEIFLQMNPQMKDKITLNDYVELRQRSIREGLYELRLVTGLALVILLMAKDWDDDGESDYKKNGFTREAYKLLQRSYLELSIFSNPLSVTQIIKNPIPIISIGTGLVNWTRNTSDETFDRIFGLEGIENDQTPMWHYTKKSSMFSNLFKTAQEFEDNLEDTD